MTKERAEWKRELVENRGEEQLRPLARNMHIVIVVLGFNPRTRPPCVCTARGCVATCAALREFSASQTRRCWIPVTGTGMREVGEVFRKPYPSTLARPSPRYAPALLSGGGRRNMPHRFARQVDPRIKPEDPTCVCTARGRTYQVLDVARVFRAVDTAHWVPHQVRDDGGEN